jgi:hypothetical protein
MKGPLSGRKAHPTHQQVFETVRQKHTERTVLARVLSQTAKLTAAKASSARLGKDQSCLIDKCACTARDDNVDHGHLVPANVGIGDHPKPIDLTAYAAHRRRHSGTRTYAHVVQKSSNVQKGQQHAGAAAVCGIPEIILARFEMSTVLSKPFHRLLSHSPLAPLIFR